jgi:hypothetical protein
LRERQDINEWPSQKQCFFHDASEFKQRFAKFCLKFDVGEQEIVDQRDPHLRQYRVVRSTHERFDLEMLLDPFEKDLDLPAFFVDECDRCGGQLPVVREKLKRFAFLLS